MTERQNRIARNEALFRSVNERVKELAEGSAEERAAPVSFVCECGSDVCSSQIELTLAEYERVRVDPAQFFVVPGHEIPDVEEVVERNEGYSIVLKHEDEAEVAIETDPRG